MELHQFYMCFKFTFTKLNSKQLLSDCGNSRMPNILEVDKVHIISDSQNCLKTLKHENYTTDDAMLNVYKKSNDQIKKIENLQMQRNQILVHWVESHKESEFNDVVDGFANNGSQSSSMRS